MPLDVATQAPPPTGAIDAATQPTSAAGLTAGQNLQLSEASQPMPLGAALTNVKQAAPGLDPATALTVAQTGGNTDQKSQAVAHVTDQKQRIDAAKSAGGGDPGVVADALSWFGHNVIHPASEVLKDIPGASQVGAGVADLTKVLNKPLSVVQHEYRYLHDVEARHGLTAALAEGLVIASGTVAGGLVAGPDGAILGGEGATYIMGHVAYTDSWKRTTDGNTYRDPHTHSMVSFGRDFASAVLGKKSRYDGTLSGVVDGIGDLFADPLGAAGKIAGQMKSVEGAKGLLGKRFGGTSINPDNIDAAYNSYRSVRMAVGQIADHDAGWVASHYPKMTPLSDQLGHAANDQEVLDVFKDAAKTSELMTSQLPTQTFARTTFQSARDALSNADNGLLAQSDHLRWLSPAAFTRRFTKTPGASFDTVLKEFTSKALDPTVRADGQDLYRLVRYSQNERTAQWVLGQWVYATPAERIVLARNTYMDVVAHMAHFHPAEDAEGGEGFVFRTPGVGAKVQRMRGQGMGGAGWSEMSADDVRSNLKQRLDELTGGGTPGIDGTYGMHLDGGRTPDVWMGDRRQSAALLKSQTGKIGLPSFTQVKRMGAELRGARAISGKIDDFAYNAITARFFKPLVLMSISYAEHIALAEAIPNALRLGAMNLVRGTYHSVSARLGYATDEREVGALTGYLKRFDSATLGKINDPLWREVATIVALKTEGHMVTRGMGAGENYSKEISPLRRFSEALRATVRHKASYTEGHDFAVFRQGDSIPGPTSDNNRNYLNTWQDWIREVSRDPWSRAAAEGYRAAMAKGLTEDQAMVEAQKAATAALGKETPDDLATYVRGGFTTMKAADRPAGWTAADDWGREIAENMRAVLGKGNDQEGMLHILDHIRHATTPDIERLRRLVPQDDWPAAVKGRVMLPDTSSEIQRIANVGFAGIINPLVNALSREPLLINQGVKEWKVLKPMVDSGVYDYDEASNIMMNRATVKSVQFVHNLHDRTQISETMRNWSPFFFAQEQAYRRMGRLLAEDPGAFRRYQMMITGVAQLNAKQQNSQGQGYYSIPGGTLLATGTLSAAKALGLLLQSVDIGGFQTSLSSANVIFPLSSGFRPDLSPIATLMAKAIYGLFPELGPGLSKLTTPQALSSPLWEAFVPNTFLQRITKTAAGEHDRSFVSSMIQSMQLAAYQQEEATRAWEAGGQKGPKPQLIPPDTASTADKQGFVNRIKNQTRILFLTNALLGFTSPTSSSVQIKDFGFKAEVNADINKYGSVSKGITEFLLKHPDATPYTVWQSYTPSSVGGLAGTPVSGATLPDTVPGENWINAHKSFIDKYPAAAYYMMPQVGGQYDPAVYNEQLAQGIRVKKSPQQFLDSLYVAAGNDVYYAALTQHEAVLNDPATGKAGVNAEWSRWNGFINMLNAAYPTWQAQGPLSKAGKQTVIVQSISQLRQMAKDGDAPKNPTSDAMLAMLGQFETYNAAYIAASRQRNYASAEKRVKTEWQNGVLSVGAKAPELKASLDAVFLNALGAVNTNG